MAGTVLVLVLALAAPASARKFQMSGTWLMRRGQTFIPLQFATPAGPGMNRVSMGNWTSVPSPDPDQVIQGSGGVTADAMVVPNALKVPRHRFAGTHSLVLPLIGSMLVQITTMFEIDAPYATATLEAGAGPGNLTWCPSNPACTVAQPIPGGIGNAGRVVYVAGPNQFGGTMQMGLSAGGLVAVKDAGFPAGIIGHIKFGGSGPTLRGLAVGGPQAGPNTPATEFVKLAAASLTAPIGGIPPSGSLITMPGPVVGMFPSITTPMGAMTGQFTTHFAFGHTTGTVLAQQDTGSGGGDFFAVMGADLRTPLGAGNLSTVAGGLARRNTLGGDHIYAQFDRVSMSFGAPVPSFSPAGFAAAGILLLLVAGYALRRRRA